MDDQRTEKRRIGDLGESVAVNYLRSGGYVILDQNYQRPWGEIDIVAKRKKKIHFIEVKTVAHETSIKLRKYVEAGVFRPEQQVDMHKKRRLRKIIDTWLQQRQPEIDYDLQVDIYAVYLVEPEKLAVVNVFPNIDLYE